MAGTERLTITLPSEMADAVKGAVDSGDYASASEVVAEALRDWTMKRALQMPEFAVVKADIEKALAGLHQERRENPKAAGKIKRAKKPSARIRRCR